MKKCMFIFLIISFYSFAAVKIPKVEQVEGMKPWWLNNHESVEGVLEGVGIATKENSAYRTEALELAKIEIAGVKNTYIDSTLLLEQKNNTNNLNVSTKGTTSAQIKATIIDSYEDETTYYVWAVEFYNDKAKTEFISLINNKNKETLENKLNYLKYLNKTVVTNKKRSKITLTNNSDNKYQKNEILNIYRLTDANINPLTKELNDFSKEKIGEVSVEEVFDNQILASTNLLSTFRIKEGDIAISSGKVKVKNEIKEEVEEPKSSVVHNSYNYNLNYEPQVFYVERSKILGPRQYELSLMNDFNNRSDVNFKMGLLRFVEGTVNVDMSNNSELNAMIKVAFPILKNLNVGMAYKKDISTQYSYAIGLAEYSFYENAGFLDFNVTSPIGDNNEEETFGVSVQIKPDKDVLIGAEYNSEVNSAKNDFTVLKLNLKMFENTWIGGGVIFDNERTYFIKISNIDIYKGDSI